jgi:hypothetical protein
MNSLSVGSEADMLATNSLWYIIYLSDAVYLGGICTKEGLQVPEAGWWDRHCFTTASYHEI